MLTFKENPIRSIKDIKEVKAITFREATVDDVRALKAFKDQLSTESKYAHKESLADITTLIKTISKSSNQKYYLALDGNTLAGYMITTFKPNKIQFLNALYIGKDYYSKGLGHALMFMFINIAKNNKANIAELRVNTDNNRAKGFYKKHKFIFIKPWKNDIRYEMWQRVLKTPALESASIIFKW